LVVLLPLGAFGQSTITISPQQCVWHAGDNPAWAAATLDEADWHPYSKWKAEPSQPYYWIRCHANLEPLRTLTNRAIQIDLFSAYQLFLNGVLIGRVGNLQSGISSHNTIRSYPNLLNLTPSSSSTIALRITDRSIFFGVLIRNVAGSPAQIKAGDESTLDAQRAQIILAGLRRDAGIAVCYVVIAIVAFMLLALFFYDTARTEFLLLAITCLSLTLVRLIGFSITARLDYSSAASAVLSILSTAGVCLTEVPFFFALNRRRVPKVVWGVIGAVILVLISKIGNTLIFTNLMIDNLSDTLTGFIALGRSMIAIAGLLAFWPYKSISARIRPLAILCLTWGTADLIYFGSESILAFSKEPDRFARWSAALIDARTFGTAGVIVALLALLFRDQRQITEERAFLAGEMQAASQIQRMLAPASLDCAPGLQIDVAFHPMREVGGDFYSCRVLPDGRERVLLGDVSGKGAAAAMTAAVLIGAAQRREGDCPTALLKQLNLIMNDMRLSGFATCLCVEISADGRLTLANAGHLAPYCNGRELAMECGLPLGITPDAEYLESALQLNPGDSLTFLSDGVVEARKLGGELFGFERTRAISRQSAEEIAKAAQDFGQEDDITVLTLTFAPVGVAHA
jgi:hypothetical protein